MVSRESRVDTRRMQDERGAMLVMALIFLSVFGLLVGVLLSFSTTSSRTGAAYRDVRGKNHAVDAALDGAINKVKRDPSIGIDPSVSPSDLCNKDSGQTLFSLPQDTTTNEPAMVVSCVVGSGSGSGVPKDLGSAPTDAVLTLGDRQTDGTSSSLGVRNTEPGPYNGNYSLFFGGDCDGNKQEAGIRENKSMAPVLFLGFPVGCTTAPNVTPWGVTGNVVSNSNIVTDDPGDGNQGAGPTIVPPPNAGTATGQIKAKYGCTGTGFTCSSTAPTTAELSDPNYAAPDISGLTPQIVPSSSLCGTNGGTRNDVVTFKPGIYTDATALNNLFKATACKSTTFLFPPVQNPTTGAYTSTGLYYFNFQNTSTTSGLQCGSESALWGIISTPDQDVRHEWCIAGAGADYNGQHVVAGAPYNWDPNASPTSSLITLEPAGSAGDGPGIFFGLIRQRTAFQKGDGCTSSDSVSSCAAAIDGKTDNYSMSSGNNGSSIWAGSFPKMSRGALKECGARPQPCGTNIEVAASASNPAGMNSPTIQINFGTKVGDPFNTDKCGPYTLSKPGTTLGTVSLSDADSKSLTSCLNNKGGGGDAINNGTIQYNVSRSSGSNVVKFDGARLKVEVANQPTFPRMPSATDRGGDCDPDQPGAEFVFGGDSHVYVPNGGLEICAGPNSSNQMTGVQIGVYGVPAVPRLVPSSITTYSAGVTNPSNAMQIAEGSGLVSATVPYNGTMTLRMPKYSASSGLKITNAALRVSYDPKNATSSNAPIVSVKNTAGTVLCNITLNTGSGMQARLYDDPTNVSPCLVSAMANNFDLQFQAKGTGSCTGTACPQLDGVQVVITTGLSDTSDAGQKVLVPNSGCLTASPNLWYSTGDDDCAILKVDSSFSTDLSTNRGHMSIKGTVYAPSAAVDIADNDVHYPIAGRGIVARHLRIRGFLNTPGYGTPAFTNYLDKSQTARAVVFFACAKSSGACTSDEAIGRAAVTFDADTQTPTIENWTVSKN